MTTSATGSQSTNSLAALRKVWLTMDPQAKKQTLRMFSNGMYVMTSWKGEDYGAATVTWVSQASFRPPLVMAAIRRDSNVYKCLSKSGVAAIHILGQDQHGLAQGFFAPTRTTPGMLNGVRFVKGITGAPILEGLPAYVECRLCQTLDGRGDHAIVVLEVVEAVCCEVVKPLLIADSPWEYGG